jgi:hypothetical protein
VGLAAAGGGAPRADLVPRRPTSRGDQVGDHRRSDPDSGHARLAHWLGSFSPDIDVLLALYAVTLASLVGLGIGALEHDLRDAGFGWRQVAAEPRSPPSWSRAFRSCRVSGVDVSTCPPAASLSPSPRSRPDSAGGYRVLWLGDPSVVPFAGWTVAPGLEAATSTDGLPGGSTLFSPPDSGRVTSSWRRSRAP